MKNNSKNNPNSASEINSAEILGEHKNGNTKSTNSNKRIIRVLIVVSFMFLSLVSYLLYFNMFMADEVASNPYNKRQWEDERYVKRGSIFDRDGELLAETEVNGDTRIRKYPKGRLYSHIIGYYSKVYGKSQLEAAYEKELMGHGDITLSFDEIRSGYDLNLTIDNDLQSYAYNRMNGKKGAVVALEPSTGKILAMVSLPDFDPSADALEKNWQSIVEREDSPLLARATGGLYPPGSTYKIVTASAAYNGGYTDITFDDNGVFDLGGIKVENYGGSSYGTIDIKKAFEVSSNYAFCTLGYELGGENVKNAAEAFGVNKDIETDIPVVKSRIDYKKMTNADAALVSIGQGQLLMSPLHVAMMGAAIGNGGKIMKPYLVNSVTTASGQTISSTRPSTLYQAVSPECASYINELMIDCVSNGTGKNAKISGITVAGKTGTAEAEGKKDHAWFVGYAPAENPTIAVAVLLENDGGSGGSSAAPIARDIIKKYLGR